MMLSRDDIKAALLSGSLCVYPLDPAILTGAALNISTTYFAFSIIEGTLLPVREETTEHGIEHFVDIPSLDTVLQFSKEYVSVDESLAGTFHSKVSRLCHGLGAVSTTLDPTWKGQLIIAANNPTKKGIPLNLDRPTGNIATLTLHRLDHAVTGGNVHDNNRGRCDMLMELFSMAAGDKKRQEDYESLKEFVLKDYAESLNGYDPYPRDGAGLDRYTDKVMRLERLKDRLCEDKDRFGRGEYRYAPTNQYMPIRSREEYELLADGVLAKTCGGEGVPREDERWTVADSVTMNEAITRLDFCIRMLDYELANIAHLRRIEWQNKEVLNRAKVESEYAKDRREKTKHRRRTRLAVYGIVPIVIAFLIADLASKLPDWQWSAQVVISVVSLMSTYVIGMFNLEHYFIKREEAGEGEPSK